VYRTNKIDVIITCPIHGDFEQTPKTHLENHGCRDCGNESKRKTSEDFFTQAYIKHKGRYDYTESVYTGSTENITFTCPEHGEITQVAYDHLRNGGCDLCGIFKASALRLKTQEKFIQEAKKVHKNKYTYLRTIYNGSLEDIIVTCPIHGDYPQNSSIHLRGCGCPKCAEYGFDKTKPAILYYLKVILEDNTSLYKIGITNRTVKERFSSTDLEVIKVLRQKSYKVGNDAYNWEKKIKAMYKQYQYKGPKVLKDGNTELFTIDIMELYYKE